MKFTIDRSHWRCGGEGTTKRGTGPTRLLNCEGYMCCLGFVSLQLGVARASICDIAGPAGVMYAEAAKFDSVLVEKDGGSYESTELTNDAININDSAALLPAEREEMLAKLFAKHGHELEFVDELPAEVADEVHS